MKTRCNSWPGNIAIVVLGVCLEPCSNNSSAIPEEEYSTKLVGRRQGAAGELKETMNVNGDGTFSCQLYPTGFIADALSQGVRGTVHGTWKITGAVITLRITGEKNELLANKTASSTIVAFRNGELILKSDHGGTSPFKRVSAF